MILSTMWEQLFVEITGKAGFFTRKYNKCRICIVDKFGTYHAMLAPKGVKTRVFAPKVTFRTQQENRLVFA